MTFVEKASDCYITPKEEAARLHRMLGGPVGLDVFHDPQSLLEAAVALDVRKGWDAYGGTPWEILCPPDNQSIHANGPYSKGNPKRTAEIIHAMVVDRGWKGEVFNLTPCAPGSKYWRDYIWPVADAVVWLGRMSFVAGRDLPNAKQGEVCNGNRAEVALIYTGRRVHYVSESWGRDFEVTHA